MKTIPLSRGHEAIVDDDDFERLSALKWYSLRVGRCITKYEYAARRDGKSFVYMHRMVAGKSCVGKLVDHINHDTLDNRKSNLRICEKVDNQRNRRIDSRNTSGYKGVSFRRDRSRFEAKIKHNGKTIHLGRYVEAEKAALAYDAAARALYGAFAKTNFIDRPLYP